MKDKENFLCNKCGKPLSGNDTFCKCCGAYVGDITNAKVEQEESFNNAKNKRVSTANNPMFYEYFALFKNYTNFGGTTDKRTFWITILYMFIVDAILSTMFSFTKYAYIILGIYNLIILLPSIALCIRRLRDTNKNPWYILFMFIPLVGWIYLIIWFCEK